MIYYDEDGLCDNVKLFVRKTTGEEIEVDYNIYIEKMINEGKGGVVVELSDSSPECYEALEILERGFYNSINGNYDFSSNVFKNECDYVIIFYGSFRWI